MPSKPPPTVLGKSSPHTGKSDTEDQQFRRGVRSRYEVVKTLLNALNFAMGLGWLGFAKVCAGSTLLADPTQSNVAMLWTITGIATAVFGAGILCIACRRASLLQKIEQAIERGETADAISYQVMDKGLHTLSTWGFTFLIAAQLNSAISATLPREPWGWRLAYVGCLLLAVALVASALALCAGAHKQVHAAVSDAIISGSAYTVALGFFEFVSAFLHLDQITKSEDVQLLGALAGCTLAVSAVVLFALAKSDFNKTKRDLAAAKSGDGAWTHEAQNSKLHGTDRTSVSSGGALIALKMNLRKLIGKVASICAVVALYTLIFVCLARLDIFGSASHASVYDPMPFMGALLFFGICCVSAVIGSAVVQAVLTRLKTKLNAIDRDYIPGRVDDTALDFLESLTASTIATTVEALAWLVGCAFHALAASLWKEFVSEKLTGAAAIGAALAYCIILSFLAVTLTFCCARPSLSRDIQATSA